VLVTAIAAAMAMDDAHVASAEFILGSVSQRMAAQLRDDAEERGRIRKSEGETAMAEVTKVLREMVDTGVITLRDPDDEEQAA
jgi:flagellar motor switch protein FliG